MFPNAETRRWFRLFPPRPCQKPLSSTADLAPRGRDKCSPSHGQTRLTSPSYFSNSVDGFSTDSAQPVTVQPPSGPGAASARGAALPAAPRLEPPQLPQHNPRWRPVRSDLRRGGRYRACADLPGMLINSEGAEKGKKNGKKKIHTQSILRACGAADTTAAGEERRQLRRRRRYAEPGPASSSALASRSLMRRRR